MFTVAVNLIYVKHDKFYCKAMNLIAKLMNSIENSTANRTNYSAKVTNSTTNRLKLTAKLTNPIIKTC